MTAPAGFDARGWGHRHAGRRAFAVGGLTLAAAPGERVLLLGASGAGKSTLLAGLAGLLDGQDSGESVGELLVGGRPAAAARGRVGLLLQDPETQLVMGRAGDDVAFGPENHGLDRDEIWARVDEALDVVGFPYGRDRPTAALSGGEKQRLALAGVLALRPGLLLLDEPTANLDPAGAVLVRDAVARAVAATGATLVVVEHRTALWAPVVDRVVVLGPDGVRADGPAAAVLADPTGRLAAGGVWVPSAASPAVSTATDRLPHPPGAGSADRSAGASTGGGWALRADDVAVRHRGADIDTLTPTTVRVAPGEVLAVVGANGAGKSTLAGALAGLVRPRAGAVRVPGETVPLHRLRAPRLARRVGTVFQDPEHQFVTRTVEGELLVAPRRTGLGEDRAHARAGALLERLGLTALAAANPFTLSGGQKRRLSVATALSAAAPVLVLDEPTFGQDARTWTALVELLGEVRAAGTAMVVVSHDEPFVARVADRVATMTAGVLR